MTRRARLGAAGLLVVLGGVALWAGIAGRAAAPQPPSAASEAAPVGVGALGRVEPASRIRKLNQPGGFAIARLETLLVTEGDRVEPGQLVAVLSDAPQKDATVLQSAALVAQARAELDRTRAAGRPSEITAQQAKIRALTFQEEINRRDAERAERLVPSGAGAFAVADRNRVAASRAAAERAQAEAELDTLARPRPEDLALAEAKLAAAAAALVKAQADAALSRVLAPIAGTVLKVYARPGDQIGTDGLLDLADLERLDVVADIYETDLPRLRVGAAAEVIVPGEPERFAATVREIGWLVRRTTQAGTDPVAAVDGRTVEVRLTLGEAGRDALRRRTNMQVQVAIRP